MDLVKPVARRDGGTIGTWDIFLSILLLFNLAFAQPLLDLLGRNVEFFLARSAPSSDIILLAIGLTVLLPMSLAALVALAGKISSTSGRVLHASVIWVLSVSLFLGTLARAVDGLPGWALTAIGLLLASGLVAVYLKSGSVRGVVRLAAPLPLLVAGLFVFGSPVSKVLSADSVEVTDTRIGDPHPVVLVAFDELPVTSLMDRRGQIDAKLFPNFARLADDSTWFRNATTVSAFTSSSVPAILDGQFPGSRVPPVLSEHPHNLFTLLGGGMEVRAHELLTRLCPETVCPVEEVGSFSERWAATLSDLLVVALHTVLPEDFTRGLPPINESWSNFAGPDELSRPHDEFRAADAPASFAAFVEEIEPADEPTLYFIHSSLPHLPWRYLPTGQEYPGGFPAGTAPMPEARDKVGWGEDDWLITQGYQQHLLQVQFVDRLIGDLLDRLQESELYDHSLIVVTADHGASFVPGQLRRAVTPQTLAGVAPVPLLIKEPSQRLGRIEDDSAQTIDVLPTIADALNSPVPWDDIDGRSLLLTGSRPPPDPLIWAGGSTIDLAFVETQKFEVVREKFALFAAEGRSIDPFEIGPQGTEALVGRSLGELTVGPPFDAVARVENLDAYQDVDPDADALPAAYLRGRLETSEGSDPTLLAVTLGGEIVAVTRTELGGDFFQAMLNADSFEDGPNELALFVVEDPESAPRLRPVTLESL